MKAETGTETNTEVNAAFQLSSFRSQLSLTYRTAAQIIAAAGAQCRDGLRGPVSDAERLDSLYIALEVAVWRKDGVRGRALLAEIKEMEAR